MNTSCQTCINTIQDVRKGHPTSMLQIWERYGVDTPGETFVYQCPRCTHEHHMTLFENNRNRALTNPSLYAIVYTPRILHMSFSE